MLLGRQLKFLAVPGVIVMEITGSVGSIFNWRLSDDVVMGQIDIFPTFAAKFGFGTVTIRCVQIVISCGTDQLSLGFALGAGLIFC